MNWRVRVPGALYRQAVEAAGGDVKLQGHVVRWLDSYVLGRSEAQVTGAAGGRAAAAYMTAEQRHARAKKAARARQNRRLVAARDSEGRPAFEWYALPDGRIVAVDATASKGSPAIGYQLLGGDIVQAFKVDPPA